jgi:hypothetical protein
LSFDGQSLVELGRRAEYLSDQLTALGRQNTHVVNLDMSLDNA